MMMEESFFIPGEPRLYAVFAGPTGGRGGLLVVTGFGEEKKAAYRNIVEMCRHLSTLGIPSLRFDLRGTGDSDADFRDCRVSCWAEDIGRARAELERRTGHGSAVLALRLGCLLVCAEGSAWDRVILCAPPASGPAYLREELMRRQLRSVMSGSRGEPPARMRERLAAEGVIDLDGIPLCRELAEDIEGIDPCRSSRGFLSSPAYVIHIGSGGHSSGEKALAGRFAPPARPVDIPGKQFWAATDFEPCPALSMTVAGIMLGEDARR